LICCIAVVLLQQVVAGVWPDISADLDLAQDDMQSEDDGDDYLPDTIDEDITDENGDTDQEIPSVLYYNKDSKKRRTTRPRTTRRITRRTTRRRRTTRYTTIRTPDEILRRVARDATSMPTALPANKLPSTTHSTTKRSGSGRILPGMLFTAAVVVLNKFLTA